MEFSPSVLVCLHRLRVNGEAHSNKDERSEVARCKFSELKYVVLEDANTTNHAGMKHEIQSVKHVAAERSPHRLVPTEAKAGIRV